MAKASTVENPENEIATKPIKARPMVHLRLRIFASERELTMGDAIDHLLDIAQARAIVAKK